MTLDFCKFRRTANAIKLEDIYKLDNYDRIQRIAEYMNTEVEQRVVQRKKSIIRRFLDFFKRK